jgi:hypothetical protein
MPEYSNLSSGDVEGGVYPPAADLLQLADTHEGFMEEAFLN